MQPGALCGCRDGRVSGLGVPLGVRGAGDLWKRCQVDFIVVEAAIERHRLGGIVGVGDLHRKKMETSYSSKFSKLLSFWLVKDDFSVGM